MALIFTYTSQVLGSQAYTHIWPSCSVFRELLFADPEIKGCVATPSMPPESPQYIVSKVVAIIVEEEVLPGGGGARL